MRGKRIFQDCNIVIVCEGTTTEFQYISDVCEYAQSKKILPYTGYKILPSGINSPILKNPNRKGLNRHMMGDSGENRYYSKVDVDYEKYKGQPTRYLREAQLFIIEDGYVEGWAVYDKDKHTDHDGALRLLNSDTHLHVAFSSYSFEEWLLCHFEKNNTAFKKSECCDKNKQSYNCGKSENLNNDCHGNICIAGRLRQQKYISDYTKGKQHLFRTYTLGYDDRVKETPLINASWLRFLYKGKNRFEANPYTDVDCLILQLMGDQRKFKWCDIGEDIIVNKDRIVVIKDEDNLKIKNISNQNFLLMKDCVQYTACEGNLLSFPDKTQLLIPSETCVLPKLQSLRINIEQYSFFINLDH